MAIQDADFCGKLALSGEEMEFEHAVIICDIRCSEMLLYNVTGGWYGRNSNYPQAHAEYS